MGEVHSHVQFTMHALQKFGLLREHGIVVEQSTVERIARSPEGVYSGYGGRRIAQGSFDETHVLRVVIEDRGRELVIVTFYPARKGRYEQDPL